MSEPSFESKREAARGETESGRIAVSRRQGWPNCPPWGSTPARPIRDDDARELALSATGAYRVNFRTGRNNMGSKRENNIIVLKR